MEEEKSRKTEDARRKNRTFSIVKFLILLAIIVGIPVYILIFRRDVITSLKSFDDALRLFRASQGKSALIYLAAQVLQIVISVLPGEAFQIAAGFIFGLVPGLILSVIGVLAGTSITYGLAKFLGEDAMYLMLGEEKARKMVDLLNTEKAYIVTFLLYLIPGTPKDMCCYVAGMSNMRFRPFLIISTVGRIPAMCGSLLFGQFYLKGNYLAMKILAAAVGILLIVLLIFRKKLMRKIDDLYRNYFAD